MADEHLAMAALRRARRELKKRFGEPCKECLERLPKAHPSMLLPEQRCRIHPWYADPRPRLAKDDVEAVYTEFGLTRVTEDR